MQEIDKLGNEEERWWGGSDSNDFTKDEVKINDIINIVF